MCSWFHVLPSAMLVRLPDEGGHQEVISGHQWSSVVISGEARALADAGDLVAIVPPRHDPRVLGRVVTQPVVPDEGSNQGYHQRSSVLGRVVTQPVVPDEESNQGNHQRPSVLGRVVTQWSRSQW